ncbi:MAG: hypothetical protein IJA31_10080 [Clostridia bacterium]|nr:hypothetical protein [Clostridia bacterium]
MALIDVINVGQGDCVVINPLDGCNYHNKCIMVDTGDGSYNITKYIGNKKVNLFITHHDKDHFGGFKYFLGSKWKNIENIILPFYQNELTLIAKAMLNLKGVSGSIDCEQFIDYFADIVNNQLYLKFISKEDILQDLKVGSTKIHMCHEGDWFCNHFECLNPPKYIDGNHRYDSEKNTEKIIEEIFNKTFAKEISLYFLSCRNSFDYIESSLINDLFINDTSDNKFPSYDIKANLFFNFITENLQTIRKFNINPNRENYKEVFKAYKQTSHDVCTVLKFSYAKQSVLLTADASKKVFNRLIDETIDIKSDYLKIPHHGSKRNIDENILNSINPKVAIISHNNRRFGTSLDSHPNCEVLDMLKKQRVKLIVTNDVIKDGEIVIKKRDNPYDKNVEVKDIY